MNGAFHPRNRYHRIGWCIVAAVALLCGCAGPKTNGPTAPDTDPEFRRSSRAARVAFDNGQIPQAIALYGSALERAHINDDTDAIVDTRYNLAVCHLQQGTYDEALGNIVRARSELRAAGLRVPPDLWMIEAMVLYRKQESELSWKAIDRVLEETESISTDTLAGAYYLRGRIAADRGHVDQLKDEILALSESNNPRLQADRLELVGRLAMLEHRWDDAAATLDRAARLRSESGDYRSMALLLAASARACEQVGRLEAAAYRYLRAARSAFLNGDKNRAKVWFQETERLADRAGARDIAEEVRHYQHSFRPQ